jgi:hypothetical protein
MGHNYRGRPQLAAREPAAGDHAERLKSRIAWMLRVNRLYGPDEAWTSGEVFSAAFAGGCHPKAVSESKISRWETGLTDVPQKAVRRYEQILGLPAWSLVSTVDLTSRYLSPSASALRSADRTCLHSAEEKLLEGFLDQVASSGMLTGAEWYEAARLFTSLQGLLLRRRDWEEICYRLLAETVAADGEAWKPRFEAYCRLLQHPSAQRFAVAACADWAHSRDNRVFIEPLSLLDGSCHPDAATAILRQLASPTNEDAFAGALLACIRKAEDGHFSEPQVTAVAKVALSVLSDRPCLNPEWSSHATAILVRLPSEVRARIQWFARNPVPCAERVARTAWPAEDDHGSLRSLIVARSISLLPREMSRFVDEVLPTLVGELLCSPLADARLYSAFLIRATPYREPVASSLAWGLGRTRDFHASQLTVRILEALRILGCAEQRIVAERLSVPSQPFQVQDAAFRALGHIGGFSDDAFWRKTLSLHSSRARAGKTSSERLLNHAVYAIAMGRNFPELHRIAADRSLNRSVSASAKWWLALPSHMLASAER